jgi:hypothetical protein
MLLAPQRQRRIATQKPDLITYQQLNVFDKANHHHHRRPGDTGEEHDFEEAHEKDSNQHSHRLYLFSRLLLGQEARSTSDGKEQGW